MTRVRAEYGRFVSLLIILPGCATVCPTGWSVGVEVQRGYPGVYEPGTNIELSGEIGRDRCGSLDSD